MNVLYLYRGIVGAAAQRHFATQGPKYPLCVLVAKCIQCVIAPLLLGTGSRVYPQLSPLTVPEENPRAYSVSVQVTIDDEALLETIQRKGVGIDPGPRVSVSVEVPRRQADDSGGLGV